MDASPRVLDLCTGPGTILLSLLHYLPNATGVGVDISNKALAVAEENRISLELADVSRFCESDIKQLLELFQECIQQEQKMANISKKLAS